MNYPIWDVPLIGGGIVIAIVAIVHVFISHFAVGGGIYLVLTERKARRENDEALLSFLRSQSLFFLVLTLVAGALTGVGIWFAISLVSPDATSALLHVFVWIWATEWVFFLVEIISILVYYYGWDRLEARDHMRVGWIYAGSAWVSLVLITGILAFMLTPEPGQTPTTFTMPSSTPPSGRASSCARGWRWPWAGFTPWSRRACWPTRG